MDKIKNIIIKGLLKDIGISERCFRLNRKITKHFNGIDDQIKKDIAYMLYDLSYTEMVLSLSRIFDKPNKKYPTRCLKSLHQIAHDNDLSEQLTKYRSDSELHLHKYGFHQEFIELLKKSNDKEFILLSTAFYEAKELNAPITGHLHKLKTIRDKLLAHNEDITIDTLIPYDMTEALIVYAKKVLSFYSISYTGVHLNGGTQFTTDHQSKKWERVFKKFISE